MCVGTELLLSRVNTNVHLVSNYLNRAGLTLSRNTTVGDVQEEIAACVREALHRSSLVIVCGGLGPTFDDVTREAVAELLNRKLIFDPEVWEAIREYFQRRKVNPPESVKKQACIIEGSQVLPNHRGTAPGLLIPVNPGGKTLILLPGPPVELEGILEESVLPHLKKAFPSPEKRCFRFTVAGLPESVVEERSSSLFSRYEKEMAEFTILTGPGVIELLVQVFEGKKEVARKIEEELKTIFGEAFLGLESPSLPELVGNLLLERRWTLTVAESCTGGMVGSKITDVPGSSAYFKGSIVAYSNQLKRRLLKVPPTLLRKFGAVSEQVAIAMAKGARKVGKSDVSLSLTGVAGPGGASPEKPVGLVWMAVAFPDNRCLARQFLFGGNRLQVRERAVFSGLDFLRREIIGWRPKEKRGRK